MQLCGGDHYGEDSDKCDWRGSRDTLEKECSRAKGSPSETLQWDDAMTRFMF